MDQKFLKLLIAECPLTDFSQNGNVTERELQLDKYLEQFTSFLYANENQLIQHFWQEYIASSEIGLLQNSEMLRRCFIFLDCAVAIYNYAARKSKGKKSSQIAEHISVQLQNDLNQYKSILLLAMNGCFNSVIVEYRSLYESFVIGQYLVQNPDLVPVYKDHLQFLRYHLTQLVGNSTPEWDKIHDDYLNKYGQEFAENYGWTKSEIVIFKTSDEKVSIDVRFEGETVWLTIDDMASLFEKSRSTINEYILNIFEEGSKLMIIRNEKKEDYRTVEEMIKKVFWNLYVPGCN